MLPIDIYLFRRDLAAKKPKTLVLYFSMFDFGYPPPLGVFIKSPMPAGDFFASGLLIYGGLLPGPHEISALSFFLVTFFSALFPELRYAFIFKGFVSKMINYNYELKQFGGKDPGMAPQPSLLDFQLGRLNSMTGSAIRFNLKTVEKIISYFEHKGVRVVILQGQYNPLAYTEKNLALDAQVREALINLAAQHSNCVYVPREKLYNFSVNEYWDGYHVKPEAAQKFLKAWEIL